MKRAASSSLTPNGQKCASLGIQPEALFPDYGKKSGFSGFSWGETSGASSPRIRLCLSRPHSSTVSLKIPCEMCVNNTNHIYRQGHPGRKYKSFAQTGIIRNGRGRNSSGSFSIPSRTPPRSPPSAPETWPTNGQREMGTSQGLLIHF